MKKDKKTLLANNFKALSDKNRLKILCVLFGKKSLCVSDIAEQLNESVAIVSHHLRALAKVGLVVPKRDGKKTCYLLLNTGFAKDLKRLVCKYK